MANSSSMFVTLTTRYTRPALQPPARTRARTAWSADNPAAWSPFPASRRDRSLSPSLRSDISTRTTSETRDFRYRHARLTRIGRRAESSLVAPLMGHDRLRILRWDVPRAHLAGSAGQKQTRIARTRFDRRRQRARRLGVSADGLAE